MNRRDFIKNAAIGIGAVTVPLAVSAEPIYTSTITCRATGETWSLEEHAAKELDNFYNPKLAEIIAYRDCT